MTRAGQSLLGGEPNPPLSKAYAVAVQALLGDPLMIAAFLDDNGVLGSYVDTVTDSRYRLRHQRVVEWITDLQRRGSVSSRVDAAALALALSSTTLGLLTAAKHLGPLTRAQLSAAIHAMEIMVSALETD